MIVCNRNFRCLLMDFEFSTPAGGKPEPLCAVTKDLETGEITRLWVQGGGIFPPPVLSHPDTLLVAHLISAEVGCLQQLGWPVPAYCLDTYAEFRALTNGRLPQGSASLAAAVSYFGGNEVDVIRKDAMRELAMRGGEYTEEERRQLLDYCESDVLGLEQVFWALLPHLTSDIPLFRGRYMRGVASVEGAGIPFDMEAYKIITRLWPELRAAFIAEVGSEYPGVFSQDHSFNLKGFDAYLRNNDIRWPCTETGKPKTDRDTMRDMATVYPELQPLKPLLAVIRQLRLHQLTVGSDGRNRYLTGAFGSITSRNQPSATRSIFGQPSFLRGLIQPGPGQSLAYLDYEQQEFGIAAALSGDIAMKAAYASGDPYLSFAVQARAAPPNATKESYREIREAFKICALGVMFGMGVRTLSLRLRSSEAVARDLLDRHLRTYPRFWRWLEQIVDRAIQERVIRTRLGWPLHVTGQTKERTLENFPMQGNGADMLRLALCLAQDAGVRVIAMVHDALLIEAPDGEIDEAARHTAAAMTRASEVVLGGFPLRTEVSVIRHPDRMLPQKGVAMWNRIWRIAEKVNGGIPTGILRNQGV